MSRPTPLSDLAPRLVLGLVVIALGAILLLDNLGWYDAWRLLEWWPAALVAYGLSRLVQGGPLSFRGHVWLALGAAGFISQFGPWGLLERWWPLALVWLGLVVTLRALFPQAAHLAPPSGQPETTPDLPQVTP